MRGICRRCRPRSKGTSGHAAETAGPAPVPISSRPRG
jgi:hypothetical protein